jgi:SAM-dependent methyltransferase
MVGERATHEAAPAASLPRWTAEILACPRCHVPLAHSGGVLACVNCGEVGRCRGGIARFGIDRRNPSIAWYEANGGTNFHERTRIPYTMSSLDTPIYHDCLRSIAPQDSNSLVVDLGSGDGRMVEPWLARGYQRVVAVEAISVSLERFRRRLQEEHPEWLDRVLCIQSDIRRVPLCTGSATRLIAIESLCYLNEDYSLGLRECHRLLPGDGRLVVAERCWEGALVISLLYGGIPALCALAAGRAIYDGDGSCPVRSRTFTEEEFRTELECAGFQVQTVEGVPVLSVLLGYLRSEGKLSPADSAYLPEVRQCLTTLARRRSLPKAYVVVAQPLPRSL